MYVVLRWTESLVWLHESGYEEAKLGDSEWPGLYRYDKMSRDLL